MKMDNTTRSEYWEIERLKKWDKNPRKATKSALERLKKHVLKFRVYKPLIVTPNGIVLGGNMRLKVFKELGLKKVWVSIVEPKNEKEMLEYALSDNDRIGYYDKDLFFTNFQNIELEKGLFSIDYKEPLKLDDFILINKDLKEDEIPEIDENNIKSKYGEVYQLGRHKLMCGDATKKEDVQKLMKDEKAGLIFTDPPYNVDYESHGSNSYAEGKFKHKKIFNDNLSDENYYKFLLNSLKNAYFYSNDDSAIYLWYASKNQHIVRKSFIDSGFYFSQIIIWVKEHFVFSRQDYQRIYEPCMYGWKEGKNHQRNVYLTNLEDVILLDKKTFIEMMDVWYEKRDNTAQYEHPTQKPVALAGRAIRHSSKIGDIVLDLFGGSGSTLIAAEQLERKAYLMELDPYYCDVIRKRYAKFIGKEEAWEDETKPI